MPGMVNKSAAGNALDASTRRPGDITELLNRMSRGDEAARDEVFRLLYTELHRIATGVKRKRARDGTLQATDLIGQAYTRLVRRPRDGWNGRGHFLATAARAMWQVLIDYVRKRKNQKAGGKHKQAPNVNLDQLAAAYEKQTGDLLKFDEVLEDLRREQPVGAQIVELRFFGGFAMQEIAPMLDMGVRSVEREYAFAKAWLKGRLG